MAASSPEVLINHDGAIALVIRNWLPPDYAQLLHDHLATSTSWIAKTMQMYGKTIAIPRTMFFLGDDHVKTYSYSRLTFPVVSWHSTNPIYSAIEQIRTRISNDPYLCSITGIPLRFDSCLVNHYRTGDDKIDPHSDKEALGPQNAVVTISLGTTRQFVFKSKTKGPNGRFPTVKTTLRNGDLVLMVGRCQELWTHSIPREPAITTSRISLTYRLISPI